MPAVAAKESWKPGSHRSPGRQSSRARTARASAFGSWDSRSSSSAASRSSPITVARSTDGWPPTTSAKPTSTTAATPAAPRRGTPSMARPPNTAPASRATLKPDTARMWYTPARRKLSSISRGSVDRSPSRRLASSAAEVSGSRAAMTPTAHRFTTTGQGGVSGVGGVARGAGGARGSAGPGAPAARSAPSRATPARTRTSAARGCRRLASAATGRTTAAAASRCGVGRTSHAAAPMPAVKAAAGGRSGAVSSRPSITHGDEAPDGRELLGAHAQDIAERLGRVEAPAPLALLDDALGEARPYAGERGQLRGGGAIDVERLDRRRIRRRRRGRGPARGGGAGRRGRGRLTHERRGWLVAIESLESQRRVGEAGAPFAHAQSHEQGEGQQDQEPELREGVEHGSTIPRRSRARPECQSGYAREGPPRPAGLLARFSLFLFFRSRALGRRPGGVRPGRSRGSG